MKWIPPIIILIICLPFIYDFSKQKKKAPKRSRKQNVLNVEAKKLRLTSFNTTIKTQGRLKPKNDSQLSFGIQGRVIKVSPQFENSIRVHKGQFLAELESEEKQMLLKQSYAKLADIEQKLEIENAAMEKDLREWSLSLKLQAADKSKNLPSRLRSHKPQIKSLNASLDSIKTEIAWRKLQVLKCKLFAPYDGYILSRNISIGSSVQGTFSVGRLISKTFYLECPLSDVDLRLLRKANFPDKALDIQFISKISKKKIQGHLLRFSSEMHPQAQLVKAIAEFNMTQSNQHNIFMNEFVEATIEGPTVNNVYALAESLHTPGKGILIVSEDNRLSWVQPKIDFRNNHSLIIQQNDPALSGNISLCTTPLQDAIKGTKVNVASIASKSSVKKL
jgi:hypothetical protein